MNEERRIEINDGKAKSKAAAAAAAAFLSLIFESSFVLVTSSQEPNSAGVMFGGSHYLSNLLSLDLTEFWTSQSSVYVLPKLNSVVTERERLKHLIKNPQSAGIFSVYNQRSNPFAQAWRGFSCRVFFVSDKAKFIRPKNSQVQVGGTNKEKDMSRIPEFLFLTYVDKNFKSISRRGLQLDSFFATFRLVQWHTCSKEVHQYLWDEWVRIRRDFAQFKQNTFTRLLKNKKRRRNQHQNQNQDQDENQNQNQDQDENQNQNQNQNRTQNRNQNQNQSFELSDQEQDQIHMRLSLTFGKLYCSMNSWEKMQNAKKQNAKKQRKQV